MNKGITLISLIITIVIILILAGVVLKVLQDNNIIHIAINESFKYKVQQLKENFDAYILSSEIEYKKKNEKFNASDLNIPKGKIEDLQDILGNIPAEFLGKICIKDGILYFLDESLSNDKIKVIEDLEMQTAKDYKEDVIINIPLNSKSTEGTSRYSAI